MRNDETVIVSIARTPIGNLLGELQSFTAPDLGAKAIEAAINRASLKPEAIEEVLMGCVLPAGCGQAPARQSSLQAGIPDSTPCTTINKVCGSGMKTIMLADDILQCRNVEIVIAGGMESMTNAPYLLKKARQGYRLGTAPCYDHMMLDGLEDAYTDKAMGYFAQLCADQFHISREQQDKFAELSFKRARNATEKGLFEFEIVPLSINTKTGEQIITRDEHPFSVNPEKIPKLPPVFTKDGTVTAGNSSSIADGAAAVTLMRLSTAEQKGIKPLARILGKSQAAKIPAEFTIAPIDAVTKLLEKLNWTVSDVDLFEINEAFAVVALVAMQALNIPQEKLNIHGGACALGHPIGASGTRIVVTLIANLLQNNLKRGVAALCIGGGEATALAVEII